MTAPVTLKIFISSPGDVGEERYLAGRVIERLRAEWAGRVALEPLFWENEALAATSTFQQQIPRPSAFDVAVCILWSRLGTRLPADFTRPDGSRYDSGTEFEMEDAARGFRASGRPRLLVYRKKRPFEVGSDRRADDERWRQKKLLDDFLDRWFVDDDGTLKAAYHRFAGPAVFEEMLESHLGQLIEREWAAHGGEGSAGGRPLWTDGSPFRGLRSFDSEHATVFCGRTAHVAAVLERLRAQALAGRPFALVAGRSGSGKSSLLRAGVLPTLTGRGVIEGIDGWRRAELVPGACAGNLAGGLARALLAPGALAEMGGDEISEEELTRLLRTAPTDALPAMRAGLARAAETLRHDRGLASAPRLRLALLIDPLDELFSDERILDGERAAFAAAVAALVRSGMVWGLAAVRSDFQGRVAALAPLHDLVGGAGAYELGPPTASEIARIVLQPANLAGLRYERDPATRRPLNEVLCDEAGSEAATLPLLSFALDELYQRRDAEGVLTFDAYHEIGGVKGALARRAEAVFQRLGATAQQALGGVLAALVSQDEEDATRYVPRRAPRGEVVAAAPAAEELVEALVGEHLLVADRAGDGTAVLSVADEALLTRWPRAAQCLNDNRDLLRVRSQLHAAAALYRQQGQLVPPGPLLAEAGRLVADGRLSLGDDASELLAASQAAEAEGERRRRRRRLAALAAAALVAVAGLLAVYLFVLPSESCHAYFVKRWGVPEGIGDALGSGELRRREWSVCLQRRGRLGRVERVVAVDADRRPTPRHEVGRYIEPERPRDDFAERECWWSFDYDSDGRVSVERAFNCADRLIQEFRYKGDSDQAEVIAEYSRNGIAAPQTAVATGGNLLAMGDGRPTDSGAALIRFLRDADGFDRELRFLDAGGVEAANQGIFGLRFEELVADGGERRKPAGLPRRVVALDARGEPMPYPQTGCSQLDLGWDERGLLLSTTCLDGAGLPRQAIYGYTRTSIDYDDDGNRIGEEFQDRAGEAARRLPRLVREFDWSRPRRTMVERYLDADGEPLAFQGYSTIRRTTWHEGEETVVREEYLFDDRPTHDASGVYQRHLRYGEKGNLLRVTFHDADGEPTVDANGVAGVGQVYEEGRSFRSVFLDREEKATTGDEGYAYRERTLDDKGRLRDERYFDPDGGTGCNGDGYSHRRIDYDKRGRPAEERFFDHRDDATVTVAGYARVSRSFGVGGRLERERFHGSEDEPVAGPQGYPQVGYAYDEAARLHEETYYDAAGSLPASGTVHVRYAYDDLGRQVEKAYLDREYRPVADSGHSAERRAYTPGLSVELSYHDADGDLTEPAIRIETDAVGSRVTGLTYLDGDDNPTVRPDGVAERRFAHDRWNRIVRESLLDLAGEPAVGGLGIPYATLEIDYDRWGRPVRQRLLDADGRPAPGLADIVQVFDDRGRPIHLRLLDPRGAPVDVPCPELEMSHDAHGYPTALACRDGDGQPRPGLAGHDRVRILRTDCGRPFAISWLDVSGHESGQSELPPEMVDRLWTNWNESSNPPLPPDALGARFDLVHTIVVALSGGMRPTVEPPRLAAAPPAQPTRPARGAPPPAASTAVKTASATTPPAPSATRAPPPSPSPEPPPPAARGDLDTLTARLLSASERLLDLYESDVEADGEESAEEERVYAQLERFNEHADELRGAYERYAGKDFMSRLRGGASERQRRAERMRSELRALQDVAADVSRADAGFRSSTASAWRDARAALAGIASQLP